MGLFDDLIPGNQSPAGGGGLFDDLIPAAQQSAQDLPYAPIPQPSSYGTTGRPSRPIQQSDVDLMGGGFGGPPAELVEPVAAPAPLPEVPPVPEVQSYEPPPMELGEPLLSAHQASGNVLSLLATVPETVRRTIAAVPFVGPETAESLKPVTQGFDVGSFHVGGTSDLSAGIDAANAAVRANHPRTVLEQQRINQEGDEALFAALRGQPGPLGEVLASPKHMATYFANAFPSLVAAAASGGSLQFIAALETAEITKNAQDYERRTGQKVDPEDFARAVAFTGAINTLLERLGLDRLLAARQGQTLTGKLLRTVLGTGTEAATEGLQEANTNLQTRANIDPEQPLGEGVGAAALGGGGAGLAVSGARQFAPGQRQGLFDDLIPPEGRTEAGPDGSPPAGVDNSVPRDGNVDNLVGAINRTAVPQAGDVESVTAELNGQSLGVPRDQMPQIRAGQQDDFVADLERGGVTVQRTEIPAAELRATQGELNPEKVAGFADTLRQGGTIGSRQGGTPTIVSNDGFILDGHHRFAGQRVVDPSQPLPALQVDLPIQQLLERARAFGGSTVEDVGTNQPSSAANRGQASGFSASTEGGKPEVQADFNGSRDTVKTGAQGSPPVQDPSGIVANMATERGDRSDTPQPRERSDAVPVESGADPSTVTTLYRAHTKDDPSNIRAFTSWTEEQETAQAYTDNQGFGGPNLREADVDLSNSLDVGDIQGLRGKEQLAEALGYENPAETAQDWQDSGYLYPWEESGEVRKRLKASGYKWLRYEDDFPAGAISVVPLQDINLSFNQPVPDTRAPQTAVQTGARGRQQAERERAETRPSGEVQQVSDPSTAQQEIESHLRESIVRDPVFHGTQGFRLQENVFDEFTHAKFPPDVGFHFGTIQQAEERISDGVHEGHPMLTPGFGRTIVPVYIRLENPVRLPDMLHWNDPRQWVERADEIRSTFQESAEGQNLWADQAEQILELAQAANQQIQEGPTGKKAPLKDIASEPEFERVASFGQDMAGLLHGMGYDGVIYNNEHETLGGQFINDDSYIVFDNEQILSAPSRQVFGDPAQQSLEWGEHIPDGDPLLTPTAEKPGRDTLRRAIADRFFNKAPSQKKPIAIVFGGGGGAGKGTVRKLLSERGALPDGAVLIDPDEIKEAIPEYRQIIRRADTRAAETVHRESSDIGNEVLRRARNKRAHVVLDKTLKNTEKQLKEIRQLKEQGYEIQVVGVFVPDIETAKRRARVRAELSGRFVPDESIDEAHRGFSSTFEVAAELADQAWLYETVEGAEPALVAEKQADGRLEILDQSAYGAFRSLRNDDSTTEEPGTQRPARERDDRRVERGRQPSQPGPRAPPDSGLPRSEGERETPAERTREKPPDQPDGRVTPPPGQAGFVRPHALDDLQAAQERRFKPIADFVRRQASKVNLAKDVPDAYRFMLRRFRADVQKGARASEEVAALKDTLSAEDRKLISDVIEGELENGIIPPEHVQVIAAQMQQAIESQTEELIRLGMLSRQTADRWRGKYLPRFYRREDETAIPRALRKQFLKIDGRHLKGRGMFEMVQKKDIEQWKKLGWEIRDPESDTQQVIDNLRDHDKVLMWRDYTPAEREAMSEVRDAVYRFARGYLETSRDIALGRLFHNLAKSDMATPRQVHENQKQIPDTEIPGTGGVKRYGALAGMWVDKDIWNDLEEASGANAGGELWGVYMKGLSFWKEGKTALNPVVHSNNIWSSWVMADLYGIKPWDVGAYKAALEDYTGKGHWYQEALDAGLFGTEFYGQEIRKAMPNLDEWESLEKAAASKLRKFFDYGARFTGARAYRRGMGRLYQAEDQFFKLLIYKDMREKGATIDEAIDEAERWIFNYADIPKNVRRAKNSPFGLPFLSYTYKAAPALMYAAFTRPWAFAKWIALMGGGSWLAMTAIYGLDHDEEEERERKAMPDYMRGMTPFLTDKAMRWPFDRREGMASYLDLSRRFPMGDMFDMENQMGGLPLPQPLMPNNPVFTTTVMLLVNKDSFTGREVVSDADNLERMMKKWSGWLAYQALPNSPVLPFSYSFDKVMNGVANAMGQDVAAIPGIKEYTGLNYYGEQQTLARAIASTTFGFKIREYDIERQLARRGRDVQSQVRDLKYQIRSINRDGTLTERVKQRQIEDLQSQLEEIVEKNQ